RPSVVRHPRTPVPAAARNRVRRPCVRRRVERGLGAVNAVDLPVPAVDRPVRVAVARLRPEPRLRAGHGDSGDESVALEPCAPSEPRDIPDAVPRERLVPSPAGTNTPVASGERYVDMVV